MLHQRLALKILVLVSIGLMGSCIDKDYDGGDYLASTPDSDCLWKGPFVKENEDFNHVSLDTDAAYWSADYQMPENGAYLTLEGDFPYSRYMSLAYYRFSDTTIASSLIDRDIVPLMGSVNPYIDGASRQDPSRSYKITALIGSSPEDATQIPDNTLYDGTNRIGDRNLLLYRNYAPNSGADLTGDVGLPRVTLYLQDGSTLQGNEACAALNAITTAPAPRRIPEDSYATWRALDPARNPPVFRANYGVEFQIKCDFFRLCDDKPERPVAGFLGPGLDYMYSFINRQYGEVLALRGRLPDSPKTLSGEGVFNEEHLRYWSICQNEYYSGKVEDCLFDEFIAVNPDGFYTILTSRTNDRPKNATAECGVSYIPWSDEGDGFGVVEGRESNVDDGFLLVRNLLPAPDFTQAIQSSAVPGDEADIMGDFMLKGQYFSKAEFEGLGCNPWLALPYDQMQ